jgi:hypothetical protein
LKNIRHFVGGLLNICISNKKLTIEDINTAIKVQDLYLQKLHSFTVTKKVGSYIQIDKNKKQ